MNFLKFIQNYSDINVNNFNIEEYKEKITQYCDEIGLHFSYAYNTKYKKNPLIDKINHLFNIYETLSESIIPPDINHYENHLKYNFFNVSNLYSIYQKWNSYDEFVLYYLYGDIYEMDAKYEHSTFYNHIDISFIIYKQINKTIVKKIKKI